jgi:addiction module HigA family antidote
MSPQPNERDWSVHPGEILREKLAEMGLSGSEAANRMGVSQPHLAQLLSGRTGVGPATAIKLETLTGISAQMWLNLASSHALFLERQAHGRSHRTARGTKLTRTI